MQPIMPLNPEFIRRLFGVFSDTTSEDATILQLQAALPMLVANPHIVCSPTLLFLRLMCFCTNPLHLFGSNQTKQNPLQDAC